MVRCLKKITLKNKFQFFFFYLEQVDNCHLSWKRELSQGGKKLLIPRLNATCPYLKKSDDIQTSIHGIHPSTHSHVAFLNNFIKGNFVHSLSSFTHLLMWLLSPLLSLSLSLNSHPLFLSQSNLTTPFSSDQPPPLSVVGITFADVILSFRRRRTPLTST